MKNSMSVITSALAGTIAFYSLVGASQAYAAHENEEKWAGIVKTGLNDCATSQTAFDEIAGGRITNPLMPDEQKEESQGSDTTGSSIGATWFKDKPWLARIVS